MIIRKIKSIDTLSLRQEVLRPKNEIAECFYEGDDDKTTAHFGALQNDTIVGVISVYKRSNPIICSDHGFQLRAMATASNVRGKGIGLKLLEVAENYAEQNYAEQNYAEQNKSNYIWANARTVAIGFYKKAGYTTESQKFEIKGVGPHCLVIKNLT